MRSSLNVTIYSTIDNASMMPRAPECPTDQAEDQDYGVGRFMLAQSWTDFRSRGLSRCLHQQNRPAFLETLAVLARFSAPSGRDDCQAGR